MDGLVAAVAAGAIMLALWLGATRRHNGAREQRQAEWGAPDADLVPRLWTSTARCPHCRAVGGLLSTESDEVWFTCLSCSQRHRREHKG